MQEIRVGDLAFETGAQLAPHSPFPHRCLYQVYRRELHNDAKAKTHMAIALQLRAAQNHRNAQETMARGTWE